AKISSYEPNHLKIDTDSERPSFLVVSEVNYPGWAAQIDGVKTPIYQTDYLLRGVALPAGKHTVLVGYEGAAVWEGVYISGFTLFIFILLAIYNYVGAKLLNLIKPKLKLLTPIYELVLKPCYQYTLHFIQQHKNVMVMCIFAAFFVLFFHKGLITRT